MAIISFIMAGSKALETLHVQHVYHRAADLRLDDGGVKYGGRAFELGGEKSFLAPAAIANMLQQVRLPAVIEADEQGHLQLLHQPARAVRLGDLETVTDQPVAQLARLFP